jgi:hypothetical protein
MGWRNPSKHSLVTSRVKPNKCGADTLVRSAGFDLRINATNSGKSKTNFKSVGKECPPHAGGDPV